MIKFDGCTTLHHIFKCSGFWSCISWSSSEMSYPRWPIFRITLLSNWGSSVISLVLVNSAAFLRRSASLRKSPTWKVLFIWWICWSFRYVSAWTYRSRSRSLIFQCSSSTSSESKGIVGLFLIFWLLFREVLWSWGLLQCIQLHLLLRNKKFNFSYSWFSSNLWSSTFRLSGLISR